MLRGEGRGDARGFGIRLRLYQHVVERPDGEHRRLSRLPPRGIARRAARLGFAQAPRGRLRERFQRREFEPIGEFVQQQAAHRAGRRRVFVLVGDVLVGIVAPRVLLRARHAHVPDRLVHDLAQRRLQHRTQSRVFREGHDELEELPDDGVEADLVAVRVDGVGVVAVAEHETRAVRRRDRVKERSRATQRGHQRVARRFREELRHLGETPKGLEDVAALVGVVGVGRGRRARRRTRRANRGGAATSGRARRVVSRRTSCRGS